MDSADADQNVYNLFIVIVFNKGYQEYLEDGTIHTLWEQTL